MAHAVAGITVRPTGRVRGRLQVPGDKSISHRYAILAALADGRTRIGGFAPGADGRSTLACLRALGVETAATEPGIVEVLGRGPGGLVAPQDELDAGNSGTTLRLLAGVLAAHPFSTRITGDESLRRRPMERIIEPLSRMGAHVEGAPGGRPPLVIAGGSLRGIVHRPPVPSAQVKSCVLLAGLHASGATVVEEPAPTRDHTERALRTFGATVASDATRVEVAGAQRLEAPPPLHVPGDISSAAFWLCAAAGLPGSDVEVVDVGLNPTRTAVLDALAATGAFIERHVASESGGEPAGTIRVRAAADPASGVLSVGPDEVPGLIDELPALAALACLAAARAPAGATLASVRGASELRAKESDRIAALTAGLRALGAEVVERPDGFDILANGGLHGGTVDAAGDHRLAMSFAIAALGASDPVTIVGADAVDVSYPGFFDQLEALCP